MGDESSSSVFSKQTKLPIVLSSSSTNQSHVADSNCSLSVLLPHSPSEDWFNGMPASTGAVLCMPRGHLNKYNESWLSPVLGCWIDEWWGGKHWTVVPGLRWSSLHLLAECMLDWTAARVYRLKRARKCIRFLSSSSSSSLIDHNRTTSQRTKERTNGSPGTQFVHNGLPNGVTTLIIMRYGAIMNYVAQK